MNAESISVILPISTPTFGLRESLYRLIGGAAAITLDSELDMTIMAPLFKELT